MIKSSIQLDWLAKKIEEYSINKKTTFQEDNVQEIDRKILVIVLKNGKTGIKHIPLAKLVGIDRKNLGHHLENLIRENLVWREPGKQGKYFPSDEIYKDSSLAGWFFGSTFRTLLFWEIKIALNLNRSDSHINSLNLKQISPKKIIEQFSRIIGAWVTYAVIQSIMYLASDVVKSNDIMDEDLLIQDWIQNAMSSAIQFLPFMLRDIIKQCTSDQSKGPKNVGSGPMEKEVMIFVDAFKKVYPDLTIRLESLCKNLPDPTELVKDPLNEGRVIRRRTSTS